MEQHFILLILLNKKTQVTRLRDTQTNKQANPSIFHVQRVQTRQNRDEKEIANTGEGLVTSLHP